MATKSKKEEKKKQLDLEGDDHESEPESPNDNDDDVAGQDPQHQGSDSDDSDQEEEEEEELGKSSDDNDDKDNDKKKKKKKKQPKVFGDKWLAETDNFNEKLKQRGVIYVARVPPRMTPTKLKSLLSEFGEVTRVYLVEEDKTVRQRRRKQGGSGSKRYTEGWVEFAKKKIAKHVAQSLNTTPITNYKRSTHFGDLWNLKYLHKFRWSHLTEKVAYERRVREQKLRVEMMQARRENASYVELVEKGKKIDQIEKRKRKRMEKEGGTGTDTVVVKQDTKKKHKKQQKQPREDQANDAGKKALLRSLM